MHFNKLHYLTFLIEFEYLLKHANSILYRFYFPNKDAFFFAALIVKYFGMGAALPAQHLCSVY